MSTGRDNCEVEDGMGFAGLVPTAEEKRADRHREADRLILESHRIRIAKLESALTAETQRRQEAEAVVDYFYENCGGDPSDPAFKYRAKYPKEPS